jgi:hypothetical protein
MFNKIFFEKAFKIGERFAFNSEYGVGSTNYEVADNSISFIFSILMKDDNGKFYEEKRVVTFSFDAFMEFSIEEIFDRFRPVEREIEELYRIRFEKEMEDCEDD